MREGKRGKKLEMVIALLTSSRFLGAKKAGMKKRLLAGKGGRVLNCYAKRGIVYE